MDQSTAVAALRQLADDVAAGKLEEQNIDVTRYGDDYEINGRVRYRSALEGTGQNEALTVSQIDACADALEAGTLVGTAEVEDNVVPLTSAPGEDRRSATFRYVYTGRKPHVAS